MLILSICSCDIYSRFCTEHIFHHNHPKTSNNKHDWTPIRYLNVLYHNRAQKNCSTEILPASYLGNLDMSSCFYQKQ